MNSDDMPFSAREGFAPQTLHMKNPDAIHRIWAKIHPLVAYDDALQSLLEVFSVKASEVDRMRREYEQTLVSSHQRVKDADDTFLAIGQASTEEHELRSRDRHTKESLAHARQHVENYWNTTLGKGEWFKFYDLCELLIIKGEQGEEIAAAITCALKRMPSIGCRLIDGKFRPVYSDEEAEAVEIALAAPFPAAQAHMKKALALFSDRESPDYANAIKEAIHAATSVARELTGEKKVGDAVDKLHRNGILPHGAFSSALKSHYGFASDEGGIRHEATGELLEPNADTARFMLVTCAAFVNYMTARKSDSE